MTPSPFILMRDDPDLGMRRHQGRVAHGMGLIEAATLSVQQWREYETGVPTWIVHCPVTECDAAPWEPTNG